MDSMFEVCNFSLGNFNLSVKLIECSKSVATTMESMAAQCNF